MKELDGVDLKLVLNYDTQGKKTFSQLERIAIHKEICNILFERKSTLSAELLEKIQYALQEIRLTGYKPIRIKTKK